MGVAGRKPNTMSRPERKVVRRTNADFPAPTPQPTPCRLFQGSTSSAGYGRHWIKGQGKHKFMHRWVWEQVYGPIPKGMHICHKCDNRLCYRLDHLFLGTQTDNNRDMFAKGRDRNQFTSGHTPLATHCRRGHEFTDENTYVVPRSGYRRCRECLRIRRSGGKR